MDKFNFVGITTFIGIFVMLFLALFLLIVKTKHKLGNRLFAFFLIANAIDACKYLIHGLNARMLRPGCKGIRKAQEVKDGKVALSHLIYMAKIIPIGILVIIIIIEKIK